MDAYKNLAEFTELTSIGITPKKLGRITNGRGTRIRVETGTVWVTHERCDEDVVLGPGESYCIKRDGITLISTLRVPFALVSIEPTIPVTPTLGERFWKFWAGLYAPQSCPTTAAL
jgi:hypothetical protein